MEAFVRCSVIENCNWLFNKYLCNPDVWAQVQTAVPLTQVCLPRQGCDAPEVWAGLRQVVAVLPADLRGRGVCPLVNRQRRVSTHEPDAAVSGAPVSGPASARISTSEQSQNRQTLEETSYKGEFLIFVKLLEKQHCRIHSYPFYEKLFRSDAWFFLFFIRNFAVPEMKFIISPFRSKTLSWIA